MIFNNNDFIDDDDLFDDDDFDVDFDDDLGYDSGKPSRPKKEEKKEEKKEVKEVKKTPKKEIKVETKKPKKTASKSEKEEDEPKKETKKTTSSKTKKKDEKKTTKKTSKKETESKKKKPVKKKKRKTKKIVIKLPVSDEEGLTKEELEDAIKAALKGEISEPEVEEEESTQEVETEEVKTEEEVKPEERAETEEVSSEEESETVEEIEEEEEEDYGEGFLVKFKRSLRRLKRYRRQIFISLGVLVFLLIGFIVLNQMSIEISFGHKDNSSSVDKESDNTLDDYHKTWQSYEDINSDYVGQIVFNSGLINKPFVQATSCYKENGVPYKFYNQDGSIVSDFSDKTGNDVYIWMDFETMKYDYDKKGGSIFMDYRNTLSDQNLIIYGHFFSTIYNKDPDRVKSFTPLEKLLEEKNYQDNRFVEIVLENEVRVYDLYAVYKFNSDDDEYWEKGQYFRPNYNIDDYSGEKDPDYMKNYIEFIKKERLYDTDITLEPGDNTLTLQTCMTPYTNLYEICVFKLIDTYIY